MPSLIDKIKEFINSLSITELQKYVDNSIVENLDCQNTPNIHALIYGLITDGYENYKRVKLDERDTIYAFINQGILTTELIKKIKIKNSIIYSIYRQTKYNKTELISSFLNNVGIDNVFQSHFIELSEAEDIFFNIIASGYFINLLQLLLLLDLAYDIRIQREILFLLNVTNVESHKTVDELNNIGRKLKKPALRPHKKEKFEELLLESMNQFQMSKSDRKLLIKDLRNLNEGETIFNFRNKLNEIFDPILYKGNRAEILRKLKPFFYLIFENTQVGLLTESEFNKVLPDQYDHDYNKYYLTTLKNRIGA